MPSYGLLPPSLAFPIFSFLAARISSAGHRHSFSTGSLCLGIPTPPSVLWSPAPQPRTIPQTCSTGPRFIFNESPTLNTDLSAETKGHVCSGDVFHVIAGRRLKCRVNLNFHAAHVHKHQVPPEGRACSIHTRGRGVLALAFMWTDFFSACWELLYWGKITATPS